MADVPPERPVNLLAAHANRRAVLMESAPDGTIRLPLLGLLAEIEEHAPIAALLGRYLGMAHPILRVLLLGEDSQGRATDVLVVAEPLAELDFELPAGLAAGAAMWVPLGDARLERIDLSLDEAPDSLLQSPNVCGKLRNDHGAEPMQTHTPVGRRACPRARPPRASAARGNRLPPRLGDLLRRAPARARRSGLCPARARAGRP